MIYEIIGKIALYIIGTLIFGAIISGIEDNEWIFCGAWLAGFVVFLAMIIP